MAQKNLFAHHPKEAVLFAEFIANFSTAEYALSTALSRFLGPHGLIITATLFHQIRNISDRLEAFEQLVGGMADLSGPCRLMDCITELKKANAFRNKLAHGVWGEDGDPPQLTVRTWLTSTSRKSETLPITVSELESQLKRLNSAVSWLLAMGVGFEPLPEKLSQIPSLEDHIEEVPPAP